MSRHDLALVLYGIGFCALVFSLVRTYYRVWQIKKDSQRSSRPNPSSIVLKNSSKHH